jgi:hypothetical protein
MASMFDPRFESLRTWAAQAYLWPEMRILLDLPQLIVFFVGELDVS